MEGEGRRVHKKNVIYRTHVLEEKKVKIKNKKEKTRKTKTTERDTKE